MQGFWYKLKTAVSRFMIGRHGVDQLSVTLLYVGVALSLLSILIPYMGFLNLIALAAMGYAVFRVYSKNNAKRYRENAWFLKKFGDLPVKARQAVNRLKNRRKYLYFDCPQCHAKLRLPRGAGNVTLTCGKCGRSIEKKA